MLLIFLLSGSLIVAHGSTTLFCSYSCTVCVCKWSLEGLLRFFRLEFLDSANIVDLWTSDSDVNAPCDIAANIQTSSECHAVTLGGRELILEGLVATLGGGADIHYRNAAFYTCGACIDFKSAAVHIGGVISNSVARHLTFNVGRYTRLLAFGLVAGWSLFLSLTVIAWQAEGVAGQPQQLAGRVECLAKRAEGVARLGGLPSSPAMCGSSPSTTNIQTPPSSEEIFPSFNLLV